MSEATGTYVVKYHCPKKNTKVNIDKEMDEPMRKTSPTEFDAGATIFEIDGVPERQGENLGLIMEMFLKAISAGFAQEQVVAIKRICVRQPRPIIAAIRTKRVCDQVISNASRYNEEHPENKLNSNHLGFIGMKIPILVSGFPSELNKIHRHEVRLFVHRNILIYHTIRAGPLLMAQTACPEPGDGASSSGLLTLPTLEEHCAIAFDNTEDEPEMSE